MPRLFYLLDTVKSTPSQTRFQQAKMIMYGLFELGFQALCRNIVLSVCNFLFLIYNSVQDLS
jgi:hypothetical protein